MDIRGLYFYFCDIGWLGKKYDDLFRKKREKKEEEVEKGGGISTVLGGEKYHFEKGEGAKNIILRAIYTVYTLVEIHNSFLKTIYL